MRCYTEMQILVRYFLITDNIITGFDNPKRIVLLHSIISQLQLHNNHSRKYKYIIRFYYKKNEFVPYKINNFQINLSKEEAFAGTCNCILHLLLKKKAAFFKFSFFSSLHQLKIQNSNLTCFQLFCTFLSPLCNYLKNMETNIQFIPVYNNSVLITSYL